MATARLRLCYRKDGETMRYGLQERRGPVTFVVWT
jgi:hypothetical protein